MPHADEFAVPPSAAMLLDTSAARLAERFAATFSPETVRECLDDSYIVLAATARVQTHVYVLAERFAAERLSATAKAAGLAVSQEPEVLFVCVHNAGRSQMAAALLHHHAAGRVTVRSAGSAPAEAVNPAVVEALAEVGVDIAREFPKPLTDEAVRASDVVITMGCGDACPIYPGKRYLNWELDDPAGGDLAFARRLRDDVDARVRTLLKELLA
ncbi:arsenate reductase ArsC [Glycomyces harbinensis]|uniref:Protein-tyrosine-phosphatase n=1 Tax=Glycomyces harbinensis TaxID=58114 RepID=A0A1G7APY6_9ACTN|nr:arsenate reductase ArsC [Glycomyces harbinensis]SDE16938.1 Protein-tyrosine-phosphatase [Glycomyces harbinensis]